MIRLKSIGLSLIFISYGLLIEAHALEVNYSVVAGYRDSNNLSQQANGETGQASNIGLDFEFANSLQREWDLDLIGNLDYIKYHGADLNSELRKDITGVAIYQSLSSNFSMTGLIDVSQAPVNRFQPQDVNNVRDQSVIAAMPTYFIPVNNSDKINLSYTYLDFNLEDIEGLTPGQASSSVENHFLANYAKSVNATNTIALNARTSSIDFELSVAAGGIDYDRDDFFFSWAVDGRTNKFRLEFGQSQILDALDRKQTRDHRLFTFSRIVNRMSTLSVFYSKGFNNPLSNIQATSAIAVNQQNNNITAAQEVEQYSLSYVINGDSLSSTFRIYESDLRQTFTENLENRKGYSLNMAYTFLDTMIRYGEANIGLGYSKQESAFDSNLTVIVANEIESYNVAFNYILSRNWAFGLTYSIRDTLQFDVNNIETLIDTKFTLLTVTYSGEGRY